MYYALSFGSILTGSDHHYFRGTDCLNLLDKNELKTSTRAIQVINNIIEMYVKAMLYQFEIQKHCSTRLIFCKC